MTKFMIFAAIFIAVVITISVIATNVCKSRSDETINRIDRHIEEVLNR